MDRTASHRRPAWLYICSVACFAACLSLSAQEVPAAAPIQTVARIVQEPGAGQDLRLELTLLTAPGYHVYSSPENFFEFAVVEAANLGQAERALPATTSIPDLFGDGPEAKIEAFDSPAVFHLTLPPTAADGEPWRLQGKFVYQACTDELCLPPEEYRFAFAGQLGQPGSARPVDPEVAAAGGTPAGADRDAAAWQELIGRFVETARTAGYQGVAPFAAFLDAGLADEAAGPSSPEPLGGKSVLLVLLAILFGGLALNLTPCVLPMIPINLAIIGAGAKAGSRRRGFALGATYGGAIAVGYGALGVVVVLTGGQFGTLNASPWFNLAIAVVFILLALAMMGVFSIDLSSLGSNLNTGKWRRGSYALAAVMGGIAALLAGACVAPVVIAVLVLAANQYGAGNPFGLIYPFVLGLGMGLPWPFAGAGLSFLPKPGGWMTAVKYVFGTLVLLTGLYYGYLGFTLLRPAPAVATEGWHTRLEDALQESLDTGKPVLVDFWATWCKNCHAMDRTTLVDPAILARLDLFVPLKFQADNLKAPEIAPVIEQFAVRGLPTYVIIAPRQP